jgi:hypothetical protein
MAALPDTSRTSVFALGRQIQLGALIQTVLHAARGSTTSSEGFHVPRARLGAEGEFNAMLSYEVEADFADDVLLKDARIAYHPTDHLTVGAGRFKVPFSYGELVSSAETDFVQRPRVVRQLSVGRRTGVDVAYQTEGGRLQWHGGVFSGDVDPAAPDDATDGAPTEEWVYATRLTWTPTTRNVHSTVGLNATYIQCADDGRARYGADVRLTHGGAFLTTELLAMPDSASGSEVGAYVTLGYALSSVHLIRAQWDYLAPSSPDTPNTLPAAPSVLGIGYTFRPAAPLRIEVDYLVPTMQDAFDQSGVFVNLQLSL